MTALFRNCRYEVHVHVPNSKLWSRHHSYAAAHRSFREAVNNRRGDHPAGTRVDLRDVVADRVLELEVTRS